MGRRDSGDMSAKSRAGLSSLLAVLVCSMAAIGAPPSEFVQEPSLWTRLEPLMWPLLFSGPAVALFACVLVVVSARSSAAMCMIGVAASMLGVTLAWGVDAEAGIRGLLLPITLLAVPLLGAVAVIRQSRLERRRVVVGTANDTPDNIPPEPSAEKRGG